MNERFDLSKVQFSRNDIRIGIKVPIWKEKSQKVEEYYQLLQLQYAHSLSGLERDWNATCWNKSQQQN